jgi:hypothetical protein
MDVWENFSRLLVKIVYNVGTWNHARPAPTKPIAIQGNDAALHILNREAEPPSALCANEVLRDQKKNQRHRPAAEPHIS